MPVTGLPAAVEKTMMALLTDNAVTSWKIAGEGDNTTFVLRFKPVSKTTTTMADSDPVLNRHTQVQYFRKKPPCQVARDQARSKQHQQSKRPQVGDDNKDSVRDRSVGASLFEEENTPLLAVQHISPVSTESVTEEEGGGVCEKTGLQSPCASDCASSSDFQPDVNEQEPVFDNAVAGFDCGVVKTYVGTFTDRSLQKRLRDQQRNKVFRKTVIQKADDGSNLLLCESDDIVLEYLCTESAEIDKCVFFYVKQKHNNMLREECDRLTYLRRGKTCRDTQYDQARARALHELHALHDLMCFYLE